MYTSFHVALLLFLSVLATFTGYLLLLTLAAKRAARTTNLSKTNFPQKFLILIPAHNEERLLPSVLENLSRLDYPSDQYEIHVVADNCTDQTAVIAQQGGAVVHERQDAIQRGKGFALEWLINRLWEANIPHTAIVILDADTIVSPNFLRVMDAHLSNGERAVQAYYAVRDPARSWAISLRYIALAALHYLRPLGRMTLGGSAGLKGNGMVFASDLMKKHQWSAHLTEDIEFHMQLILAGERVTFAPDAMVEAEMPDTLHGAQTQNARWERGRLEMARRYIPLLWQGMMRAWKARQPRQAYMLFDAMMEHLIPPFSIFAAASGFCLFVALLLPAGNLPLLKNTNVLLGMGIILGQIIYTLASLSLVKASSSSYKALLYAPVFILWKIGLYLKAFSKTSEPEWVRTARNKP